MFFIYCHLFLRAMASIAMSNYQRVLVNTICIYMEVSSNRGTLKSSIFIGFSINYKPSILRIPHLWKPLCVYIYIFIYTYHDHNHNNPGTELILKGPVRSDGNAALLAPQGCYRCGPQRDASGRVRWVCHAGWGPIAKLP